jgi:tape measure domain-containing protein
MALEDLTLKINVGVLRAESALATLGKVKEEVGSATHRVSEMVNRVGVASASFATLGSTLSVVGGKLGTVGTFVKGTAGGLLHMMHMAHAAHMAVELLGTAFAMLLVPLRMIGAAVMFVGGIFRSVFGVLLIPVKMLWGGLMMLARVVTTLMGVFGGLASAAFKVWFIFKGWIGAVRVLWDWLGMLPPKIRLVVGGLLVLGAAGKAGAAVLGVLSGAARLAATAFQLLSLPVLVITNPMRALTIAASLLGRALVYTGSMAMRAAASMWSFASSVGSAVGSVVGMIAGKLLSAAKAGVTGFLLLGAAVSAWGIKLAAKAETGAVVFGTMLKNMEQGKALQKDLESWSGAALFDADAVQLSGVLLFKAGVAANDIKDKLNQLGQVAAATKTPLDDLARIYQQGMNQGAFQQDKINQLSDRGIAIYEGLAHATGKSGLALKEMIRDGKIGPAEMNAALEHLTTGQGIYAGSIQNIGQTTEGMFKNLKNTVALAARELGSNLLAAFDFKGMMTSGSAMFVNLRTGIANAMPLFQAWAIGVKAAFAAVWEIATVVFNAITGSLGLTAGNWMTTFMEFTAIATWAFQNWPDIATLAFVNVGLSLVRFGADFAHIFTGVMPALFSWFGDNWSQLFMTAASFVGSVFTNIGKNIMAIMTAVWDFIVSGGTKSLSVAWTPLLDGFKNTVAALPDIPPRAIGELEAGLAADSARLGESLGTSLGTAIDTNMKLLSDFQAAQAVAVNPILGEGNSGGEAGAKDTVIAKASKKAVENKAAFVRSSEGQSVVQQFMKGFAKSDDQKKAANAAVASAKSLANIERDTRRGKQLEVRGFA